MEHVHRVTCGSRRGGEGGGRLCRAGTAAGKQSGASADINRRGVINERLSGVKPSPSTHCARRIFPVCFKEFRVFAVAFSSAGFFSFVFFRSAAELSGKMKGVKTHRGK